MMLLLVAGCTVGPAVRPASEAAVEPVEAAKSPATTAPSAGGPALPESPAERPRNAAAVSLQATAEQQRAAGDLDLAAATLERALRIDSRDPRLWLSLAEIRLEQGDPGQAAALARRAETLAAPGSEDAARARALAARAAGG